jgi:hypothetical protein
LQTGVDTCAPLFPYRSYWCFIIIFSSLTRPVLMVIT